MMITMICNRSLFLLTEPVDIYQLKNYKFSSIIITNLPQNYQKYSPQKLTFMQSECLTQNNSITNASQVLASSNQYSPKIVKPLILKVSKKILNRQSIFKQQQNCSNVIEPKEQSCSDKKSNFTKLNEQTIKNSRIYTRLQERIQQIQQNDKNQIIEHQKNMQMLNKMIQMAKQKIHQMKYEGWEAKNQIMELEEELEEEVDTYNRLKQEICALEQQGDEQQFNQQYQEEGLDENQEIGSRLGSYFADTQSHILNQITNNQLSQYSSEYDDTVQRNTQSRDLSSQMISKKSCSIKQFLPPESQSGTSAMIPSLPFSQIEAIPEEPRTFISQYS